MSSDARTYYFERFTPQILVISAFGPLLIPSMGVRIDQLLLYGFLPIAIGLFCVGRRSLLSKTTILSILFIFVFITVWTLIVTLGGVPDHVGASYRTIGDELASFENYLQTIALIIVLGVAVDIKNGPKSTYLLDKVGYILIIFMCLNALVAISTIFFGPSAFAKYFVPGYTGSGDTPFELIANKGRFTGIFDVPSAAGSAYTIALIIWAYLTRKSKIDSIKNYLLGGFLIIGGTLTISKIFIFGGIPLFIIYWLLPGRISSRMTLKLLAVLIAAVVAVIILAELWIGLSTIDDLFVANENYRPSDLLFHFIQARYGTGENALIGGLFSYIWDVSPVQGLGFAYLGVADSAYLLYFMEGGMISLVLYGGFIGFVIFLGVEEWYRGNEIGRLLAILGGFVLLAGVGAPIITMPRVGVIFWTIIILGLAVRAESHAPRKRDTPPAIQIGNANKARI